MRWHLYGAIWFLQVLDIVLTWQFLGTGLVEGNPLGRVLIGAGWWPVIAVKLVVTTGFWATWRYLARLGPVWRRGEAVACVAVVALLAGAAGWNLANMAIVAQGGWTP